MRRRSTPSLVLVLAACTSVGTAPPPPPAPDASPAALTELHEAVRVAGLEERRFGYRDYWSVVEPYLGATVRSRVAGHSAEGRAIRQLTFGSGPTTVLLWSQMHGNESTASMALADVVGFFARSPSHPLARRIAEGATVHMIPMLNPDGAERFRRRNAQGIDVNRDARELQTPEGRLLKAVRDELDPDFGFNLHDQNAAVRVGRSDLGVAIALLAPAFNEARDVDAKRRRAMQVASTLVEAMDPLVGGHIAKYDDTFNPRAFGDLMGAWGASTVLIESGGWRDDPEKQHLRKANFVGILYALDAIATGRVDEYDPAAYESLAFNGRRMPALLMKGGTIVAPGIPALRADVLIDFEFPLRRSGGYVTDLGDLGEAEAQDTVDVSGLYLIPLPETLGPDRSLDVGRPAWFLVAEDPRGERTVWAFRGEFPRGERPAGGR